MAEEGTQKRISGIDSEENLLDQVQHILNSTDPDKWRHDGDRLNSEQTHKKSRKTWDRVYCTTLSDGVLVLRSTQKLSCEYLGLGYKLSPIGNEEFYVEIRGDGFHPQVITDPFRQTEFSNNRCELLAGGEVARALFCHVEKKLRTHREHRQREFTNKALEFLKILPKQIAESSMNSWKIVQSARGTRYLSQMQGWQVRISYEEIDGLKQYGLQLCQGERGFATHDVKLTRELYRQVEQTTKVAGLRALHSALTDNIENEQESSKGRVKRRKLIS